MSTVTYFKVSNTNNQLFMIKENLEKYQNVSDCPVRNVLNRIGDKWSILIITILGENGTMRFNQINHTVGNISQKMLTVTLKTLEADGLISRKIYPVVPPKVEYTLTPLGESLLPAIETLTEWALRNMPAILTSRKEYLGY